MKILFVSPVGALFSGAEVSITNLMVYLSQMGHTVFNVIPDNETNRDEAYWERMTNASIKTYQLKTMKWWWDEAPSFTVENKVALSAYYHKNIAEIRQIIRDEEIELVISNTANVFQGAIAAACERVPHYYIIHEFPYGEFGYYRDKIDLMNQLSDKIFAVEGELYNELLKLFPAEKLYPFIPYSHIEPRDLTLSSKKRLVAIGGINRRKNQLELIKAFHHLAFPDLELVFIGGWDESYKKECDEFIRSNNLETVTFLGHQKSPWSFIRDNDCVIFSSKLEAFPLVYVEAILNGVPVIVSDNPGHLSVYETLQAGLLYRLGSVEELSQKIEFVLNHFDEEKEKARVSQQSAFTNYTLEKCSKIFVEQLQLEGNYNPKNIVELSSLLGIYLSEDMLTRIKGEQVAIFFSKESLDFTNENRQIFPLESQGFIEILIDNIDYLRIDLSENPGMYHNVKLTVQRTGEQLVPLESNATVVGDDLVFMDADPQMIYNVIEYQNETLLLEYIRCSELSYNQYMKKIHGQAISVTQQLTDKAKEYDELLAQYHSVMSSRRWTIPTKIINFFRRK